MPAPTDISGLINRFRASQVTGYANGASVSSAAFETGGFSLSQATAGNQPTYASSSVNGLAGIRFNGTSSFMTGTPSSSVMQPYTITFVVRLANATATQQILDGGAQIILNDVAANTYGFYGGSTEITGGTPSVGAHAVTIMTSTSAADKLYVDGTLVASGEVGSYNLDSYRVGSNASAGRYFNGDICEIVAYNKGLSSAELVTLDTYIQSTYGIAMADATAGTASNSRFVRNVDLTSLVVAATGFQTANTQAANYTLVRTDVGKAVEMNMASANTVTIPTNASVAFPVGTVIDVYQAGPGATSVQAVSGVTLRAPLGTTLRSQYATVRLRQRALDEWVLSGNLLLTSSAGLKSAYPPGGVTSGLMLWLEAENLTGLYDGQGIASLTDGSGNYRHATQATAGYQPLYRTTAASVALPNNQPIAFFDGSDDFMAAPLPVIPVPMTMIVVLRDPNPSSGYRPYIDLSAVGAGGTRFILSNSNGPNFSLTGSAGATTSKAVPSATYFLATVILAADGSATFFVNGTQVTVSGNPGTVGTHTSQPGYVMNRYSDGSPSGLGIVRAIDLVYNRAITAAERNQIESMLISKYGIA